MAKICFFGDSITEEDAFPNYVAIVQEKLPDHEIINAGVSGDLAYHLYQRYTTDVEIYQPDYVILMIGTNDYLVDSSSRSWKEYKGKNRLPKRMDAEDYAQYLRWTTAGLENNIPGVKLVCMTSPPIANDTASSGNQGLNRFINIMIQHAAKNRYEVIDINKKWKEYLQSQPAERQKDPDWAYKNPAEYQRDRRRSIKDPQYPDRKSEERGYVLTTDGVHPNTAGAQLIAETVVEWIERHV